MNTAKAFASLFAVTSFLLCTACGQEEVPQKDGGNHAPSKVNLEKGVLAERDLPGYVVQAIEGIPKNVSARADVSRCQPIVNVTKPESVKNRGGMIWRSIAKEKSPSAQYLLALFGMENETAARRLLADVRVALKACESGFDIAPVGLEDRIRNVSVEKADGGEETVSFSTEAANGMKVNYVLTRQGSVLTRIAGMDQGFHQVVKIPQAIIDKQVEKASRKLPA